MQKLIRVAYLLLCAAVVTPTLAATSASVNSTPVDKGTFATTPTLNDGAKWRIAYIEGGEHIDY